MPRLSIGVFGSDADLKYGKEIEKIAEETGRLIAERDCALLYGAEKDQDSLPTIAARSAKKHGGLVIAFTYGKGLDIYDKSADIIIPTGMIRGGGREFSLALSCHSAIAIAGGAGTLAEVAFCYMAEIPVVALVGSGDISDEVAGKYLDRRTKATIYGAHSPEEAVDKAVRLGTNYLKKWFTGDQVFYRR